MNSIHLENKEHLILLEKTIKNKAVKKQVLLSMCWHQGLMRGNKNVSLSSSLKSKRKFLTALNS